VQPKTDPTDQPTEQPTRQPTDEPTTPSPTSAPTDLPTAAPTHPDSLALAVSTPDTCGSGTTEAVWIQDFQHSKFGFAGPADLEIDAAGQNRRNFEHGGSRYVNQQGSPFYSPADGSSYGRPSGRIDIDIERAREHALAYGLESFTHRGTEYNRRGGMSDVYDPDVFQLLESDDDTFEDARQQPQRHQQHREHPHHPHPVIQQERPKKKAKRITPMLVNPTDPGNLMGGPVGTMGGRVAPMQIDAAPGEGQSPTKQRSGPTAEDSWGRAQQAALKRTNQQTRAAAQADWVDRFLSKRDQVLLEARLLLDYMLEFWLHEKPRMTPELEDKIRALEPAEEDEDREVDPTEVVEEADALATCLDDANEKLNQRVVDELDTRIQRIYDLDKEAIEEAKRERQAHAGQEHPQQQQKGMLLSQLGQGQSQQQLDASKQLDWMQQPVEQQSDVDASKQLDWMQQPVALRPGIETKHLSSYGSDRTGALKRIVQSHNTRTIDAAAQKLRVKVKQVKKVLRDERARLAHQRGLSPEQVAKLGPDDIHSISPQIISSVDLHDLINHRLVTTTWPVKGKGAKERSHVSMLRDYAARTGKSTDEINRRVDEQHRRFGRK
jgi:hypothetical protein